MMNTIKILPSISKSYSNAVHVWAFPRRENLLDKALHECKIAGDKMKEIMNRSAQTTSGINPYLTLFTAARTKRFFGTSAVCLKDPCKKDDKKDPCKKKEDPCKKEDKKDPCKKKEDPCKKEDKKDPCKKKEDPCKKEDNKDPCKKKEDPCKKKDPCKKEDPCKKKDPCKKEDPCKKAEAKDPGKKKGHSPCEILKEIATKSIQGGCGKENKKDSSTKMEGMSLEDENVVGKFDIFKEVDIIDQDMLALSKSYSGENYKAQQCHAYKTYAFHDTHMFLNPCRYTLYKPEEDVD